MQFNNSIESKMCQLNLNFVKRSKTMSIFLVKSQSYTYVKMLIFFNFNIKKILVSGLCYKKNVETRRFKHTLSTNELTDTNYLSMLNLY